MRPGHAMNRTRHHSVRRCENPHRTSPRTGKGKMGVPSSLALRFVTAHADLVPAPAAIARSTATTAATAATTATAAHLSPRPRLVHGQPPAVQRRPVQRIDGRISLFVALHLDEPKTTRAPRFAVLQNRNAPHSTKCRKRLLQHLIRRRVRQISHVDPLQRSLLDSLCSRCADGPLPRSQTLRQTHRQGRRTTSWTGPIGSKKTTPANARCQSSPPQPPCPSHPQPAAYGPTSMTSGPLCSSSLPDRDFSTGSTARSRTHASSRPGVQTRT